MLIIVLASFLFMSVTLAESDNVSSPLQYQDPAVNQVSLGTGFYEFRGNVDGARVFLDGQDRGVLKDGSLQVPVLVYDSPQSHELSIDASGYTPYNETLIQGPKVGETFIVRGTLQKLPMTLTGTLSLAVSPPGGMVYIDDEVVGVVDQSGIMTLRSVKSGNRVVKVTLPGYQDAIERVSVDANLITKVRITMLPVTTGTLEITSVPAGAGVLINGAPNGTTPVTIPDLPAGTYALEFTLPGYQNAQSQVTLTAGQKIPVTTTLQPVPTPTPIPTTEVPTTTPTPTPTQAGMIPFIPLIGCIGAALCVLRKRMV
jgi:hypothetical protein